MDVDISMYYTMLQLATLLRCSAEQQCEAEETVRSDQGI